MRHRAQPVSSRIDTRTLALGAFFEVPGMETSQTLLEVEGLQQPLLDGRPAERDVSGLLERIEPLFENLEIPVSIIFHPSQSEAPRGRRSTAAAARTSHFCSLGAGSTKPYPLSPHPRNGRSSAAVSPSGCAVPLADCSLSRGNCSNNRSPYCAFA
jgi:hypothetical protein